MREEEGLSKKGKLETMPETMSPIIQKSECMTVSESIQFMKKLLEITGEMHERGKLLNATLENMQILPGKENLKNSVLYVGFRAPEAAVMDHTRIGKQSDYYAITAIFYYCLTGRTISRLQMFSTGIPDVSDVIYRNKISENTSRILCKILKKGLVHGLRDRYQSLKQMKEDLEKLEKCIKEEEER